MTEQTVPPPESIESTSDDRLWALLAYLFTPIVPVIILLLEDKKDRPFLRGKRPGIGVGSDLMGGQFYLEFHPCWFMHLGVDHRPADLLWRQSIQRRSIRNSGHYQFCQRTGLGLIQP